ncbi:hypothetical protein PROFUN_09885 [Planoprotostelium fungivorum]|uniref:Uncharacterized protein n=1 Tax=Planoprotostelium fungivorum TaxID=1890364 RepID=A0A2P6NGG2_9EUKA|nr:hypothetical protein PROFUN_09885 [Planoprotostelium fungivorum]
MAGQVESKEAVVEERSSRMRCSGCSCLVIKRSCILHSRSVLYVHRKPLFSSINSKTSSSSAPTVTRTSANVYNVFICYKSRSWL